MPYAIGGALALGFWGFPRATVDVDLDVFVPESEYSRVAHVLGKAGCAVDPDDAARSGRERGDFRAFMGPVRVDVFLPSIPFYESVAERRTRGTLEGRATWYLAAEDLAVFKLLFFRPKDLVDLERLVGALGDNFDRAYVSRWIAEIVGADDSRNERWRQLLADVDGRQP